MQLDRPITGGGGRGEGGGEASFKSRGSLQAAVYSRRKTYIAEYSSFFFLVVY